MRLSKWQLNWIYTKYGVWTYPITFIFRCGRTQNGFGESFSKNRARYFKQFWYIVVFLPWKISLLWLLKWFNICYLIQELLHQLILENKISSCNFLNENIFSGGFSGSPLVLGNSGTGLVTVIRWEKIIFRILFMVLI